VRLAECLILVTTSESVADHWSLILVVAFLLLVISQFKVDSICLPMFLHYGSFSIGPCRQYHMYAKLSGTNLLKIDTCHVNFLI